MKGQEIINHIVRAKMPDREQVRENCHRQAVGGTVKKRSAWITRVVPVTACAAVLVLCIWAIPGLFSTPIVNTPTEQPPNNPVDSDANTIIPGLPDEVWPDESERGIYIPAIELPTNTDGVEFDMIGLFIYQGRIYTQAAWYYNDDAQYIKENLVGERIGFAKGNINEWSTQDEYATEFAGSAHGYVYTVKGYDESFRLCMTESYTDDDGNDIQWVNFYERLNGIGLGHGHNLFEDRLHLSDNWSHVKYQRNDDWHYSRNNFNDLTGVTDDDIAVFINAMYDGMFENVHETFDINDFYKNGNQTHLYVYMNDGTVIELRLFEGGYVGYQHLGWYFVKIPGEAFDTVFNACT